MARENDLVGLLPTMMVIPVGATAAVLIQPVSGEASSGIKYYSGGTLEIHQAPRGTTYTGAELIALAGTGYLMGASEAINFDGGVRYYLMATGATVVAYNIRGLTAGY